MYIYIYTWTYWMYMAWSKVGPSADFHCGVTPVFAIDFFDGSILVAEELIKTRKLMLQAQKDHPLADVYVFLSIRYHAVLLFIEVFTITFIKSKMYISCMRVM